MYRFLASLVAAFIALNVQAYTGYRGYDRHEPAPYIHAGLGMSVSAGTPMDGLDLLVAGDLRGVLLGVNTNVYAGNSSNTYGYNFPNVKYTLRKYCLGANVGTRLVYSDNFVLSVHCLFGEEFFHLGKRDSIDGKKYGRYVSLGSQDFFYIRPAIGITNRRNFSLMASYDFLFTDNVFGSGKMAFGSNPTAFNGPELSVFWLTNRHRYSSHGCHRGYY